MSSSRTARIAVLASALALALAPAAAAVTGKPLVPRGQTGGVQHVLANSALLTGLVIPNGQETTYYFVYGPTTSYGSQTTPATIAATIPKQKVGQAASHLLPSSTYHFALVVTYPGAAKPIVGHDHTFATKGSTLTFEVPRTIQETYGTPFLFTGTLRGLTAGGHQVVLQASPFPFTESFTAIGAPTVTNSAGRFAFRVANLNRSTELRLSTLDPLPVYSRPLMALVAPRVSLHVRHSGSGLVRLYGTITPAVHGAQIVFQVQKTVRPNHSEVTTRFVAQFTTAVKKGSGNTSRFSTVVSIRHGGLYRAYVKLKSDGPLASGWSNTVLLHKH